MMIFWYLQANMVVYYKHMFFSLFFAFSGWLLAVSSLVMSCIMLMSWKRIINIMWFLLCLSMSLLWIWMFFIGKTFDPQEALFWWQFSYVWVISTPFLVLKTTYLLLWREIPWEKYTSILLIVITVIFHYLNIQWVLIDRVTLLFNSIYFDMPMTLSFKVFFFYFNLVFTWIFIILILSYLKEKSVTDFEQRKKILFFSIWISCWAIWWYSVYFPILWFNIYPYGSLIMSFYPIVIGYSILRHHLFDAKYAILQIMRLLTVFIVCLLFVWMLAFFSVEYLKYIPVFHPVEFVMWIVTFWLWIWLFRSKSLRSIFLIGSLKELDKEVALFIERKGLHQSPIKLLSDLEEMFWRSLKVKKVEILTQEVTLRYPAIIHYFKKHNQVLVLSDVKTDEEWKNNFPLLSEVTSLGEVIFPIEVIDTAWLMLLVLWKKESDDNISDEEIRIISRMIPKITLALQVIDYHFTLQNEVRTQTKAIAHKNKELEAAYRKLEEIDKNKDNFLAIASHELRTPMTIIKGYADLFLQNALWPISDQMRAYMEKIFNSSESLIQLVNNILDISKIEAWRFEIIKSDIDIVWVVSKCIDNFKTLYEDKWITLVLTNKTNFHTINTDESKVILLCNNLLSNAYKFTSSGGQVELKVFDEAGFLHISVTDTGMGIESSQLSHVFEKFNQADNSNNYTKKSIHGTGLGLYLCKQIVELLGWSIRVESERNKWSSFTFTLPLSSYDVPQQ